MSATAFWLYLGGAIAIAVAALVLFAFAMLWDRSRGRRRCPRCWYVIHADSLVLPVRCSECGREIRREKDLHRTRRRWKLAAIHGLILLCAAFLAVQPKVQPYGWGSMTPMSALLLLLQFDDTDWVVHGINSQINHDLFHRMRAPDFLDHADPAKGKAMWRWQWRRLGRTILPRLENEDLSEQHRRTYLDWLALCREFAGDAPLSAAIAPIINAELEKDDSWARHRAPQLSVDYRDIDGSIARLMPHLESEADASVWGAMLGLRSIALRDQRGVDLLLSLLEGEDPRVRSGAVSGLGFVVRRNGFDPAIHDAVDAMKDDDDCNVRWARIVSLANMLSDEEMWRRIEAAMRSDDICVRRGGFSAGSTHAREHRGRSARAPASVVAIAVESIGDDDESVRWNAAWIVEEVARSRRLRDLLTPHIEAIEAHAEHEDAVVQRAMAWALHYVGRR